MKRKNLLSLLDVWWSSLKSRASITLAEEAKQYYSVDKERLTLILGAKIDALWSSLAQGHPPKRNRRNLIPWIEIPWKRPMGQEILSLVMQKFVASAPGTSSVPHLLFVIESHVLNSIYESGWVERMKLSMYKSGVVHNWGELTPEDIATGYTERVSLRLYSVIVQELESQGLITLEQNVLGKYVIQTYKRSEILLN